MNSFSAMQRAIEYEFERQVQLIDEGEGDKIVQETRLWEEAAQVLFIFLAEEVLLYWN